MKKQTKETVLGVAALVFLQALFIVIAGFFLSTIDGRRVFNNSFVDGMALASVLEIEILIICGIGYAVKCGLEALTKWADHDD